MRIRFYIESNVDVDKWIDFRVAGNSWICSEEFGVETGKEAEAEVVEVALAHLPLGLVGS